MCTLLNIRNGGPTDKVTFFNFDVFSLNFSLLYHVLLK